MRRGRTANRRRMDPVEKRARIRGAAGGLMRFVLRVFFAIVFVGGVFGVVIGLYLWATTSPSLAVTEVRIDGNRKAALDELAPLTGIRPGTNIFLVDGRAAERRLETHPWVRSSVVRKEPPGRILVAVREYEPAAMVALGPMYLADAEGTVFKQAVAGEGVDLPILSGIDLEEADEHRRAEVLRGLEIVERWAAADLPKGFELSQIHLDPLRGSTLTATWSEEEEDFSVVIHLAASDIDERLSRLSSLLDVLSERGERPKEIFLDNRSRPQWVVARTDE